MCGRDERGHIVRRDLYPCAKLSGQPLHPVVVAKAHHVNLADLAVLSRSDDAIHQERAKSDILRAFFNGEGRFGGRFGHVAQHPQFGGSAYFAVGECPEDNIAGAVRRAHISIKKAVIDRSAEAGLPPFHVQTLEMPPKSRKIGTVQPADVEIINFVFAHESPLAMVISLPVDSLCCNAAKTRPAAERERPALSA